MNNNNHILLAALIALSLIAGFTTYFISPDLNKTVAQGEEDGVTTKFDSTTQLAHEGTENSTITNNRINNAQFPIDKSQFKRAPEFAETNGYINTAPIKLADLRGKVVLVNFWTYTCINWIRTIPYLVDWNEKYANKGLVIVGVHTPEFEFEKNTDNVMAAVDKFGLRYPIVQDNDKGTWNAYENRYWPRIYLVDSEGNIRYDHIGEGGYAETEKVIQSLLQERAAQMGKDASLLKFDSANKTAIPNGVQSVDFSQIKTPELYFGYQFARTPLGNTEGHKANQIVTYTFPPSDIKSNIIYLDGKWKNNAENMELESETGRVALVYSAKSVNIIAGGNGGEEISVSEGRKLLSGTSGGPDLSEEGKFLIDGQRLYTLSMHDGYGNHSLILDVKGKGFQAYAFSFG
jgi:thiol-disulfide isomerase/thioredoxin